MFHSWKVWNNTFIAWEGKSEIWGHLQTEYSLKEKTGPKKKKDGPEPFECYRYKFMNLATSSASTVTADQPSAGTASPSNNLNSGYRPPARVNAKPRAPIPLP